MRKLILALFLITGVFGHVFAQQIEKKVTGGAGNRNVIPFPTGAITGAVHTIEGAPLKEGTVFFFSESMGPPPSAHLYWRVPDFIERLDKDGGFTRNLPPGNYYISALKRASKAKSLGFLQPGDIYVICSDINGKPIKFSVQKDILTNAGIISGAAPYAPETIDNEKITAIEGTVIDINGKPVEGVIVFAYYAMDKPQKPVFGSTKTGKDGKYTLFLDQGGTFYLRARDAFRAGPAIQSGGLMGVYGDLKPEPINIKTGEIATNKDIKTRIFPSLAPQKK